MKGRKSAVAAELGYKSLLVRLDPFDDNSSVLRVAGELAGMLGSHVIGVCAAPIMDLLCDEGSVVRKEPIRDRAAIEKDLEKCADAFQASLKGLARRPEWRSTVSFEIPADYVAAQARSADLVISRAAAQGRRMDEDGRSDLGRLAIKAGRPLLLVPDPAPEIALKRAIVAWKNVREARRAVFDALPILHLADEVTLLSVASDEQRPEVENQLKDLCQWLKEHGITSEMAVVSTTASQRGYLHAELLSRQCDFLVAGAYGRTRLDGWIFGGVTESILLKAERLTFVSH